MTLADFARSIGVAPATARQWKRRGKIVERDGGFELVAQISADGLILPGVNSVTVASVTEPVQRDVTDAERDIVVTVEPSSWVPGVTEPKRDNAPANPFLAPIVDQVVRALSDRLTKLEDQRECRDLEDDCQWQTIKRLEGEIAELRAALATTNNSLIDSNNVVLALQTEVAFLRSRIAEPAAPAATRTVSRGGPIDPPGPQWGA